MSKNVRAIASQIVTGVLVDKSSLSHLINQQTSIVEKQDRPLLQELVYGVLRWQHRLNFIATQLLNKPLKKSDADLHALILVGLYQLAFMRIAEHASLNETVNVAHALNKSWATKLINGVLRSFQRQREALLAACDADLVAQHSHPLWLIKKIQAAYPHAWERVLSVNNQYPPMTLRVNQQKITRDGYLQLLLDNHIQAMPCDYASTGITLAAPRDVQQLPLFNEGFCSVQDEAAQLCVDLLTIKPNLSVLDACAAPGGKTVALLEKEPALHLTALDQSNERLVRLHENLARLQLPADVVCADAADLSSWWKGVPFDRILLDAPCSGSGVIRRHPDIKSLREPSDITSLATLQRSLLKSLWNCLANKGLLLYATCSVLPEENQHVINAFLADEKTAQLVPIAADWGVDTGAGKQLLPTENGHDGFFYCLLSKTI